MFCGPQALRASCTLSTLVAEGRPFCRITSRRKCRLFFFFSEVCKALNKTRGLYRRWLELQDDTANSVSKDELEWTTTELRNALRSIEWDLEDLEDTIDIL